MDTIMEDTMEIPEFLYEKSYEIELCLNMMFINELEFLPLIGYPLYYKKCDFVEDNRHETYYKAIDKAIRVYNAAGFRIKTIKCD